ncbi:MAG TPA: hypothetical protein VGR97_14880, partial [Candidatus Acidoferrales bacterium]|nr:hypothetical protein [Candidatus Acidoferrales bacterium]
TKDGKLIRAGFTRYLGVGAIYSITPIDEAAVRELLPRVDGGPEPRRWSFQPEHNDDDDDDGL